MTDRDLFPGGTGPGVTTPDSPITLAIQFEVTSGPQWLKGFRFWRATTGTTGPIPARLYEFVSASSGNPVAGTDATFTLSGTGWQEVLLPTLIPLTVGQDYRAALHFPNGYAATSNYFTSGPGAGGITNGPLFAPDVTGVVGGDQGSFHVSAALAYPDNSFSGDNYWVSPLITDVDPGGGDDRTGVASIAVAFGGSAAGVHASSSAAGALAAFGGSAAGAHAASAPVSSPAGFGSSGAAGAHVAAGAASSPIALGSTRSGTSDRDATATAPLGLGSSAVGDDMNGVAVSEVLCSAWATPADIPDAVKAELGLSDAQLLDPLMRASEILWALSGRRWYGGGCVESATVKSVRGQGSWPYHASWGSCACWGYSSADLALLPNFLHISRPVSVKLPRSPITGISSVLVNGVAMSSANYELTRSGWLDRVDGGSWDACAGNVVITYTWGEAPPAGGRDAAVVLAIELAKDFHGIDGCSLPKRVTSVTRQGVSIAMLDNMEFLDKGRTGLTSVDLWLAAVNPNARPQRAGVWSPDVPNTRRHPL